MISSIGFTELPSEYWSPWASCWVTHEMSAPRMNSGLTGKVPLEVDPLLLVLEVPPLGPAAPLLPLLLAPPLLLLVPPLLLDDAVPPPLPPPAPAPLEPDLCSSAPLPQPPLATTIAPTAIACPYPVK
jgi:hypothetical protein